MKRNVTNLHLVAHNLYLHLRGNVLQGQVDVWHDHIQIIDTATVMVAPTIGTTMVVHGIAQVPSVIVLHGRPPTHIAMKTHIHGHT